MADRCDQHMTFEYRSMIKKGDQLISAGDHGGTDFAACNLAEDVSHRTNARGGVIEQNFDRVW